MKDFRIAARHPGQSARRIAKATRQYRLFKALRAVTASAMPGLPPARTRAEVADRLAAMATMERRMTRPQRTTSSEPSPASSGGTLSPTSAWIAETNASQRRAGRGKKRKRKAAGPKRKRKGRR